MKKTQLTERFQQLAGIKPLYEFDRDTPPEGPPELDKTYPENSPFEFLGHNGGEEYYFARDGKHFVFIADNVEQGHTDFSYSRDDGDGYEDDGIQYDDVLSYNGEPYESVEDIVNNEWGGENYMQWVASIDDGNTDLALITQNDTRSEYWDDLVNLSQKF
jgi:hypothetical protein